MLADAVTTAAQASMRLADQVAALRERWLEMTAHRRRDSGAVRLLDLLPGHPIVSAASAAELLGSGYETGRAAVDALAQDGVLTPITLGRRHRAWETHGLFALVDQMERQLSGGAVRIARTET